MASCDIVIYMLALNTLELLKLKYLRLKIIYSHCNFLFYQKFSHGCFLATDLSAQICMEVK